MGAVGSAKLQFFMSRLFYPGNAHACPGLNTPVHVAKASLYTYKYFPCVYT